MSIEIFNNALAIYYENKVFIVGPNYLENIVKIQLKKTKAINAVHPHNTSTNNV